MARHWWIANNGGPAIKHGYIQEKPSSLRQYPQYESRVLTMYDRWMSCENDLTLNCYFYRQSETVRVPDYEVHKKKSWATGGLHRRTFSMRGDLPLMKVSDTVKIMIFVQFVLRTHAPLFHEYLPSQIRPTTLWSNGWFFLLLFLTKYFPLLT